ncbi:unnamed protein product [Heterobilharzia americana]|nr:unnamed protein product [Heterobilharzia americana]
MVLKIYTSTLSGNLKVKKEQGLILSLLNSKKVDFKEIDLSDISNESEKCALFEELKKMEKSLVPPHIFLDNEYLGSFEEFYEALEMEELESFLKLPGDKPKPFSALVGDSNEGEKGENSEEEKSEESATMDKLAASVKGSVCSSGDEGSNDDKGEQISDDKGEQISDDEDKVEEPMDEMLMENDSGKEGTKPVTEVSGSEDEEEINHVTKSIETAVKDSKGTDESSEDSSGEFEAKKSGTRSDGDSSSRDSASEDELKSPNETGAKVSNSESDRNSSERSLKVEKSAEAAKENKNKAEGSDNSSTSESESASESDESE